MLHHETGILPEFDDRREIRRMLEHLTPQRRVQWLQWCCEQVSDKTVKTRVIKNGGSLSEVWNDWASLCYGSRLTVRKSGDRLHEMIKGKA